MSTRMTVSQQPHEANGRTLALQPLRLRGLLWHVPLLLLSLVMLYPFLWMILSSFKTTSEVVAIPPTFFPQNFSLTGYQELVNKLNILRNFFNSVFVSGIATLSATVCASLAGFVFAHYQFRGKNLFFTILLTSMMLPAAVTVLPLHALFNNLRLGNTYTALILPYALSGFSIFLMRQFMQGIPTEIFEAARIDGASDWMLYRLLALPLTLGPLGGVAVFTFLTVWNQFWWPLMITNSADMRTMALAVALSATQIAQRFDVLAAGAVLAIAPIVILFALATRQVVEGIAFSGMKEG